MSDRFCGTSDLFLILLEELRFDAKALVHEQVDQGRYIFHDQFRLSVSSDVRRRENSSANACPVYDFLTFATCSGVPVARIRPPCAPPSGPRSMIQSAVFMT